MDSEVERLYSASLDELVDDNCSKMEYFEREGLQHRNYKKYESHMRGHSYRKRCAVVYKWIELVLEEWKEYVQSRGQDWTRDTEEGRQEIESLAKATKTLKPLQDQLKRRRISQEILNPIYVVVRYERIKDMEMANEKYYCLSIGDQPWPIGVTMVGIHERKGRAKIFSSQVEHVMNDPVVAEYIRSVKRLLTYCERHHL